MWYFTSADRLAINSLSRFELEIFQIIPDSS